MSTAHVLYRMFDATDRLLYVGITCNPGARIRQHRDSALWWSDVSNIRVEHFASRRELERAEQSAIKSENPIYNVARYGDQRERRTPPMVPISAIRTIAGWSLNQLADEVAKHIDERPSTYTLRAIEIGHREASPDLLNAIEAAYGLTPGTIDTTWDAKAPRGKSAVAA